MNKKRLIIFFITVITLIGVVTGFSKQAISNMNLGLDLQGGFEILYEIKPLETADNKNSKVDMAAVSSAVSKRVDVLGVSEPDISVEGKNRVRVQLAGVKDNEQARKVISSNAILTFRDTKDNLLMDSTVLKDGGASVGYEAGKPIVQIKIADKDKFYKVTEKLSKQSNNQMVIWLDYDKKQSYAEESKKKKPAYISAATVSEGLNSDTVQITGNFTEDEAKNLADLLNSGSLNFKMNEIYSNVVSPDLGAGSFDKTIFAGGIGIIAIMLLLIILYRVPGIVASIAIAAYTFATLWIYNTMGGVFTLSGIAALVLGVGMAVDSSVITMERIKESLYQGRSVKQAYKEGTHKSLSTIMDSQLTTLISAIILYCFGTGSVKGFATMLMISTILTIVFNVSIVRFLLGQLINSGYLDNKKNWFGVKTNLIPNLNKGEKSKYKNFFSNFDFVKNAKYAISISLIIITLGFGFAAFNGIKNNSAMNLGIDFSSGTKITIVDAKNKLDENKLQDQIDKLNVKVSDVKINSKSSGVITFNNALSEKNREKVCNYLTNNYKASVSDATVSPVVGQELVKNAIIMSLLSWLAILIYISIRFKWDYAISGIVALIHDVLIILSIFVIFRLEVNTDIIAVLLTIIGYSINDSIVCFDRIRENVDNLKKHSISDDDYKDIVNKSLQETIVRSIVTSVTTMIPVICLILLGSNAIFTFNIALLIGLIAGTNSSIFIAAQLWYYLRKKYKPKDKVKKKLKKVDEIEEVIIPGIND